MIDKVASEPINLISEHEVEIHGIRASGPGGQNVNKVSSAVHLRFVIASSSLPEEVKQKLSTLSDRRISKDGIIVIKAQRYRTLEKNREDALERLNELVGRAMAERQPRRKTRPTQASRVKRMDGKARQGRLKALRRRVDPD